MVRDCVGTCVEKGEWNILSNNLLMLNKPDCQEIGWNLMKTNKQIGEFFIMTK